MADGVVIATFILQDMDLNFDVTHYKRAVDLFALHGSHSQGLQSREQRVLGTL
jgi:hypothetical protein